jgi:hypothetical protein
MKENNVLDVAKLHASLLEAPHVLPTLIDLFTNDVRDPYALQDKLQTHLTVCHYCRVALLTLLALVQDDEQRNKEDDSATGKLLQSFVALSHEIEASELLAYEQLGAYAETIIAEGKKRADQLFPDVAEHIKTCTDCRSAVAATVSDIIESDEAD